MYTSFPMYECFGFVTLQNGTKDWIKGFEVGVDAKTGLYVFFVGDNVQQRYYLKESELNYSKEKPE